MQQAIHANFDGSYTVIFPGDPTQKAYTVRPEEVDAPDLLRRPDSTQNSNKGLRILTAALQQYDAGGEWEKSVFDLLLDDKQYTTGAIWAMNRKPVRDVKAVLQSLTSGQTTGRHTNIVASFGATPKTDVPQTDPDYGKATVGGGHAYTITAIDWDTNTIEYANPWDTSKTLSMSIDQFCTMSAINYALPSAQQPAIF